MKSDEKIATLAFGLCQNDRLGQRITLSDYKSQHICPMFSYRHAFHAGNFADVHKHIVLSIVTQSMLHKDSSLCYQESHAGIGRYDLHSAEAQKNTEFQQGILQVWREKVSAPTAIHPYLTTILDMNSPEYANDLRYYPGSPRIIRHCLRAQDRMILMELHPTDIQYLKQEFSGDRQVSIHHLDGYHGIKAFLPPKEKRSLVLIDPPFENKNEMSQMINGLQLAYRRCPQGIYLLWFPITNRSALNEFYHALKKTNIRKMLSCELCIHAPVTARQLNGSLMIIVNPPWQIENTLRPVQSWLSQVLERNGTRHHQVEWLVPE